MIRGAEHRSRDIYLTAEENTGKSQLGDRRLKWDPLPQNEVGRIAQGREEDRKQGKDHN